MGYQGGRRYGGYDRDRFSGDRYGGGRDRGDDRYRGSQESYRYGTRGQFGGGYDDRRPPSDYDPDERGFFDRAGDEIRSWFGDEEAERRREYDDRYNRDGDDDEGRYASHGYAGSGSGGSGTSMARGGGFWSGGYARDRARYGSQDSGNYAGGGYSSQPSQGHDPNYHAWRQERIAELDRDYSEYQRENRDRFHQEFTGWRTRRNEQRQALAQVREHMEVVGSDGEHIGTVDKLRGDRIVLTKSDGDAGGVHHSVPCGWIKSVDAQKVTLEKTAEQAQTAWRTEREQQAMFGGQGGDYGEDRSQDRTTSGGATSDASRYR
ncbi:MAG: DUF2171 domain-containing protein [Sphingobium sp.]|nr:DUF2171 domain-containing protein [Sphingobium sp.]